MTGSERSDVPLRPIWEWTGGEYSLYRIALAGYLASYSWIIAVAAIPVILGWHARLFWLGMLVLWHQYGAASVDQRLILGILIILQIFIPGDPYFSLARRNCPDPGVSWKMPVAIPWIAAFFAVAAVLYTTVPVFPVLFLILLGMPPAMIRPTPAAEPEYIFYDGDCALCHGFVRFVLAQDPQGTRFRFAPLDSDAFRQFVPDRGRADLPDSIIVRTEDGVLLPRFAAVQHILAGLGGYWGVAAVLLRFIPLPIGDAIYDFIASHRYRVFGKTDDACPLMPPQLRNRFDM